MRILWLLLLAPLPLQAAAPLFTAPQAPVHVNVFLPPAAIAASGMIPSSLTISPLAPPALTPSALRAAPLLAAAVDPGIPAEAAAAGGEKLTELLQGANPLTRVKVAEVAPGIVHMKFPTQRLMASTFLRFQEHYESPKFRGKVFTLEEFKAWYASQRPDGRFTYYKDWDGFNIPSRVLTRFKKGDFDPLDPKEKALLARFSSRKNRFYLIGTRGGGDSGTLRHEVAHGLYYTRPAYRRRAQTLLRGVDLKPVLAMLERLGYHKSVWLDEAHAYLGDDPDALRSAGVKPKPYAAVRLRLLALQKEYASGLL